MPKTELDPIDVTCPKCGANPGEECVTPSGRSARDYHSARTNPRLHEDEIETVMTTPFRPLSWTELAYEYTKPRMPKRLKFKVRDRSHVWCDHHGAVHPAHNDYFDEGSKDCYPLNWRRVYIESDDKKETF